MLVNVQLNEKDRNDQLRAIYLQLLTNHDHFDEFRAILACYPVIDHEWEEPGDATWLRLKATERAREWTGIQIESLSVAQMLALRDMTVDQRHYICASPWKESNVY